MPGNAESEESTDQNKEHQRDTYTLDRSIALVALQDPSTCEAGRQIHCRRAKILGSAAVVYYCSAF
jgi:hypothetical protein